MKTTAIGALTELLHKLGRISSLRVSSAQERGAARHYSYWGIARYEIRLGRKGHPINAAIAASNSDHRGYALTLRDADSLAKRQGWVRCKRIGELSEEDAVDVLRQWSKLHPIDEVQAAARLRAIKKWTERDLVRCGLEALFTMARPALDASELAAVRATELHHIALRQKRAAWKLPAPQPTRTLSLWRHGIELDVRVTRLWYHHPLPPPGKRMKVKNSVTGEVEEIWQGKERLTYCVADARLDRHSKRWRRSWREAIRGWISDQHKRIGPYLLYRQHDPSGFPMWSVSHIMGSGELWRGLRSRRALAKILRKDWTTRRQVRWAQIDPEAPDTLGWRCFLWIPELKRLISPQQGSVWHTAELRVEKWQNDGSMVRGEAGIHACRMPIDWRRASIAHHSELHHYNKPSEGTLGWRNGCVTIVAVVERFGKYVLGTEGWRAEVVVIRKLRAPSTAIGLALEQAYPEVEVFYDE